MATFTESGLEIYPISIERYLQMAEHGILDEDEPVELLRGVITPMSPEGKPHQGGIQLLTAAFAPNIDWTRFTVQIQSSTTLWSVESVPQPDVAIIAAPPPAFDVPVLIIEASATSLRRDMRVKSGIYAGAGVLEYWVIDIRARAVHVHRNPSGAQYLEISTHSSGELTALTDGIPPLDVSALLDAIGTIKTETD